MFPFIVAMVQKSYDTEQGSRAGRPHSILMCCVFLICMPRTELTLLKSKH